jgi:hypothetical protein
VASFARAVLALSQDAITEGSDEELTQAMADEMACLKQQMSILKSNLPPINTKPTSTLLLLAVCVVSVWPHSLCPLASPERKRSASVVGEKAKTCAQCGKDRSIRWQRVHNNQGTLEW